MHMKRKNKERVLIMQLYVNVSCVHFKKLFFFIFHSDCDLLRSKMSWRRYVTFKYCTVEEHILHTGNQEILRMIISDLGIRNWKC